MRFFFLQAYWLSYIYKQLVGQAVLSVNVTVVKDATPIVSPTNIRAYAHCTNKNTRLVAFQYSNMFNNMFNCNTVIILPIE